MSDTPTIHITRPTLREAVDAFDAERAKRLAAGFDIARVTAEHFPGGSSIRATLVPLEGA